MLRSLRDATEQQPVARATHTATSVAKQGPYCPTTGRELRAQLSMQQTRNSDAMVCNGRTDESCAHVAAVHYRWRITGSRCGVYEACFLPETTHAEVSALYPGAKVEPLPGWGSRTCHGGEHDTEV